MGVDRFKKSPCGFAFVEYVHREDALGAVAYLSGTKMDGRVIRVELDAGFKPGREFGRGTSGGQVRDDRRNNVDPARNGGRTGNRWQAPQNKFNTGSNDSDRDQYDRRSGQKRGRDSDSHFEGPSMKNSRFQEERSDDDM